VSVPAGTSREIVIALHKESTRILALPEIRDRMAAEGAEFVADTPEQFTAFLRSEIEKWGKAVKASGARLKASAFRRNTRRAAACPVGSVRNRGNEGFPPSLLVIYR
jgi:hypothetical protein